MNHAYGIKKFILKEEAELPSVGYGDVLTVKLLVLTFYSICLLNMVKITYLGLKEENLYKLGLQKKLSSEY